MGKPGRNRKDAAGNPKSGTDKDLPRPPSFQPPVPQLPSKQPVLTRPAEPIKPYDVTFPSVIPDPLDILDGNLPIKHAPNKGSSGINQDADTIIDTQKQTIARLLEEAGYASRALERFQSVEKSA